MKLTWLVCRRCGVKEALQPHTEIAPCPCGAARYAEDDDGRPMVLWSAVSDPTDWSADDGAKA